MSESVSALKSAIVEAKRILVNAMIKVVMEHDEDFHNNYDYYFNNFGINEEETEDNTKVLKIVDMYNGGGCCFPHAYMHHETFPTGDKESWLEWHSFAFLGLYVVEVENKFYLKYYVLYNEGMEYDSNISEPDHDYTQTFSLDELEKLSEYLQCYVSQRRRVG